MDSVQAKASLKQSLLVLGRSLGAGGFGSVHEARWGNQPCAAKMFFFDKSDVHQHAIQKEIALLQKLRCRHIIQFYRAHEEDGRLYLLMELAEKGSLSRAIAKGGITQGDWSTKRRLATDIARGLAFMHQENILHRDLKSANVLLTKHMEVKLADFGLAKVQSAATAGLSTGPSGAGLTGTLRWIAPELLFATNPPYSRKSDVYALGVVMWEMAAGCTRPFKDQENDALVALAINNGSRETFPADTPEDYREWAERCWDQDPTRRPDASEVVLVCDEIVDAGADDDDKSFVDLSITDSDLTYGLTLNDGDDGGLAKKKMDADYADYADQYVGQLPSTDDDVVTHLCMSAKRGSADAQLFLGWIYDHGRGVEKSEKDSFWWYHQAAYQGPTVAQLRVAKMYELGQGVDKSDEKAASWYRRAAEGGSALAQYQLGEMYADGRGVTHDDMEAVKWYSQAANQGHCDAQATLGLWYSLGRGVIQSDEEAFKWLIKAAEQGSMLAQGNIGMMHMEGRGVEQNDATAARWLTKAAEKGHASSQKSLGQLYQQGRGVEQNHTEAFKWYGLAAGHGDRDAQNNLGLMYEYGRGVEQSDIEAVKWFAKAAEQGDPTAQFNLGLSYQQGQGVGQDDGEAMKLFIKAAEQGDTDAQWMVGCMYDEGRGVEEDGIEAVKWYIKAAEQGNSMAQYNLGLKYRRGRRVEKNFVMAASWFTKAAEQGDRDAQYQIGCMYDNGRGVEQSDTEASKWYRKAAEQGHAVAQRNLGWAYDGGLGVEQSDVEAVKWFTKAAEQDDANAQNALGWSYDLGKGVDQSDHLAFLWYSRGADNGSSSAQFNLALMYELGLGVDPDGDAALRMFRQAATKEEDAHFHIEWLTSPVYLSRQLNNSALDTAALYRLGAEQGYAAAQYYLGRTHERARGVAKDTKEAMDWYSKAAARGHTESEERLKILQQCKK